MTDRPEELAHLRRRALQFLVHCFLYYRLNESVIPDEEFDRLAEELRGLRVKHPQAEIPHADLIDAAVGPEATGFQIRHYPPRIVSTAFKLLYAASGPEVDFREFVERRGYRVEMGEAEAD